MADRSEKLIVGQRLKVLRRSLGLTQAQMAPLMGMSLSGYRKWEQGQRRVSGPAATLLRVIEREPGAVQRALEGDGRPR